MLTQSCLQIEWVDLPTGRQVLHQEIRKFIAGKYRLGVHEFPEEFVTEFIEEMKTWLTWAADQAETSKMKIFWQDQAAEIEEFIRTQISQIEYTVLQA